MLKKQQEELQLCINFTKKKNWLVKVEVKETWKYGQVILNTLGNEWPDKKKSDRYKGSPQILGTKFSTRDHSDSYIHYCLREI